jgi:hypothetical protein
MTTERTDPSEPRVPTPICSLPVIGPTTVEDAVFYAAVGAAAAFGWVSWPAAALIGGGHGLHQRARNVVRTGDFGEARAGVIDAIDEVL